MLWMYHGLRRYYITAVSFWECFTFCNILSWHASRNSTDQQKGLLCFFMHLFFMLYCLCYLPESAPRHSIWRVLMRGVDLSHMTWIRVSPVSSLYHFKLNLPKSRDFDTWIVISKPMTCNFTWTWGFWLGMTQNPPWAQRSVQWLKDYFESI